MRTVLLALLLAGCADPDGDPNGAIEITGYLDGSRVSFTRFGGDVIAVGRDGAASAGSIARLAHQGTGEAGEAEVTPEETFVVGVPAADGDPLALTVDGAAAADAVELEVPVHGPFPVYATLTASPDPAEAGVVQVDIGFAPANADGLVWVAAPAGQVVVLDVHDGGHLHAGRVPGEDGDALRLHWVSTAGEASAAIEVVVHP